MFTSNNKPIKTAFYFRVTLMHKFILLALLLISFNGQSSEDEALTIDKVVSSNFELAFPNDKNIKPQDSEFALINYVVMSNLIGERWAVLTLKNTSAGNRMLEQQHIMALFADGSRSYPAEIKLNFEGKETQSITVSFGENKFPILSVQTSTEI